MGFGVVVGFVAVFGVDDEVAGDGAGEGVGFEILDAAGPPQFGVGVHHSGVWVSGGLDADAGVGKLAGREGGFQDFLQVFGQGGPLRRDLGFYDARYLVVVAKDVHDAEA